MQMRPLKVRLMLAKWKITVCRHGKPNSCAGCSLHQILCKSMWLIGQGNGNPLQYSCLENLRSLVGCSRGVPKSRTRLNDFTFTFHFHALEKAMATRSSVLAWRIPGTGEPGGLPSMGLHRVGHDWSDLAAAAAAAACDR